MSDVYSTKTKSSHKTVNPEENMKKLKQDLDLNKDSYISQAIVKFEKENKYFRDLIKADNILDENNFSPDSNFNDEVFEEKMVKIFQDNFKLESLDYFPYFEVVYSKVRPKKVTQLSYFQVTCFPNKEKSKEYYKHSFWFNKEIFAFHFLESTMIFDKSEKISNLFIITKDFDKYVKFKLNKGEKYYDVTFKYKDIIGEVLKVNNDIEKLKSEIENCQNKQSSDYKDKSEKLKILENIKTFMDKKYNEKFIMNLILEKENEIQLVANKIKLNEITDKDPKLCESLMKEKKNLLEEKSKYEKLISNIYIKIEKIEKELDGFFISRENMTLSNNIGDELKIPKNSPIIVEVKNNNNYPRIIKNIEEKKKLIYSLGLDLKSFYFVGILRGITFTSPEEKLEAQKKISNFDYSNTIVLYPEGFKFYQKSLITSNTYNTNNTDIIKDKMNNNDQNTLYMIQQTLNKLNNQINKMQTDINELKSKIK